MLTVADAVPGAWSTYRDGSARDEGAVVMALREGIINWRWPPGAPIKQNELVTQFSVSKTPVREAIAQLRIDGFVRVIPRQGTFVCSLDLNDVRDVTRMRQAVEPSVAELAAIRHTDDSLAALVELEARVDAETDPVIRLRQHAGFHVGLAEITRSPLLCRVMQSTHDHLRWIRTYVANSYRPVEWSCSHRDHVALLTALHRRDGTEAQRVAKGAVHHDRAALVRAAGTT